MSDFGKNVLPLRFTAILLITESYDAVCNTAKVCMYECAYLCVLS